MLPQVRLCCAIYMHWLFFKCQNAPGRIRSGQWIWQWRTFRTADICMHTGQCSKWCGSLQAAARAWARVQASTAWGAARAWSHW